MDKENNRDGKILFLYRISEQKRLQSWGELIRTDEWERKT